MRFKRDSLEHAPKSAFEADASGVTSDHGKYARVKILLLDNRRTHPDGFWGCMSKLDGKQADKKCANKFLLACVLDMQLKSEQVWSRTERYVECELGGPSDLFFQIADVPEHVWKSPAYKQRLGLHWLTYTHNNVWDVATEVVRRYEGDASQIWNGRMAADVVTRLKQIGVGIERARMTAGALRDTGQIAGESHLKADTHTTRVLGRVFTGSKVTEAEALKIAEMMVPGDTWQLDFPLYDCGKDLCRSRNPSCGKCYLRVECDFATARLTERLDSGI